MIATPKRIRITGVLFILLAAALIVTARQARAAQGDITFLVEGLGWATVAAAVWLITAPGPFQRLTTDCWFCLFASEPRRVHVPKRSTSKNKHGFPSAFSGLGRKRGWCKRFRARGA
jgi:hypothetical protein